MILLFYLVFGCLMDSLSMILLTVPIFFPIISTLDFGLTAEQTAIWFGILALIAVEVGLITPPVGMNLFIIQSMAKETPITFRPIRPSPIISPPTLSGSSCWSCSQASPSSCSKSALNPLYIRNILQNLQGR